MNVNGSRFDLLLGRADWGRCLDGDGEHARTLGSWWDGELTSPPVELAPRLPAWDAKRNELGIRPVAIVLPVTPSETPFELEARRGAAADRHGNVYRIGDDRQSLSVLSAGSRHESTFWPAVPSDCEEAREGTRQEFAPIPPSEIAPAESYRALATTCDDYLVVAFARGAQRGFLTFDLMAGGPPMPTLWPTTVAFEPFDMATRHGGGVWVLDREYQVLWELDGKLAVVRTAQPSTTLVAEVLDDFQPLSGKPRERPAVVFPGGIGFADSPGHAVDPIAVEAIGDGVVLLLDRDSAATRSRVVRLRRGGTTWEADASRWLDELPDLAHDFVYASALLYQNAEPGKHLFIATSSGNQVRAYAVTDLADAFMLSAATELFPLRRFGGRALVAIKDGAHYDSGTAALVWTPIVQQPRALFERVAEFVTPVFDSAEIGTTWDRVLIDACLPPDTTIEIFSRAGDERADLLDGADSPGFGAAQVVGTWLPEPPPYLRSAGPELPWLRGEAARDTRRESGVGTWELLLQNARGRYAQLRIVLASANGVAAPRLRALRVWSPRFSYPQRFLPGVYREDPTAGPFLERWLANMESTLTNIEDRVVNVEALFDPRIVPAEALAWLAGWFDVAFDAEWDERRQRLFVERAMDFFRWRGTVHGLRLALALAFDECIEASDFEDPASDDHGARGIRIVEAFQARLAGGLVVGDPGGAVGPLEVRREARWTPREGNAGLIDRYARVLGREATLSEQIRPFSLVPPAGDGAVKWREFSGSALGFVPAVGAAERARWQRFLLARYASTTALAAAHGVAYASFADVELPRDAPVPLEYAQDWRDFCAITDGASIRLRWQDFLARRYRRIERLNRAHETRWPGFDVVALPDVLPGTEAAQVDWLQFEGSLLAMLRTAHRFSVLLPVADVTTQPYELERRLGLARRIIELEKPAHTVFDVRFYWAFFRVGEARLGIDTQLGAGSRAPELIPEAVLGRAYVGASFVGGPARPEHGDRHLIAF